MMASDKASSLAAVRAAAPTVEEQALPDRLAGIERNKLAILTFIASEAIFFILLILAYIAYRQSPANAGGPTAASSLDIKTTSIFTVCLFASSFTVWMADRSRARANEGAFRLWLAATIGLGAVFLVGQASEYLRLLNEGTTINRDLFGTTFYTLTGFHGFHVLVGLIALSILLGLALAGKFKGQHHNAAIECISLYWHFVDAVWVAVFSIVYIWTALG